ncbi:MAG TPA: tetratricopeptide repeat protein [Kofleriaceae bacterium]|nr:tetratricopeptide repeat protein [Kofleriaceae bacterium]
MDVIASESYARPRRGSNLEVLAIWAALALSGCGPKPAPREPTIAPVTLGWIARAEEQEKVRQYNQARLLYLRAKRESPDDPSRAHAAAAYGSALIFWGELPAARRELVEAVRLQPNRPGTWHDLGHVEHQLGDVAAAERALRQSIRIAPRDPRSRVSLAALLVRARRFAEAIGQYEQLLELELPDRVRKAIEQTLPRLRAMGERERPSASILQP